MDGVTEGGFGNSMLEKAVEKVKSFMEGMEKEWRVMSVSLSRLSLLHLMIGVTHIDQRFKSKPF